MCEFSKISMNYSKISRALSRISEHNLALIMGGNIMDDNISRHNLQIISANYLILPRDLFPDEWQGSMVNRITEAGSNELSQAERGGA
jgi:hypothetical protein